MAKVLIESLSYSVTFNTPRFSRHHLISSRRLPLEKIWAPLEAVAIWKSVHQDYQLIHSFNGIPYTNKPWFVTFEVYLPYLEEGRSQIFQSIIQQRLALDNCRKIIAMSNYAKFRFIKKLKNWHLLDNILNKLEVIHPNLPLQASQPKLYDDKQSLNLVFVGNSFARKGGIVVLRLAKKAHQIGLPIHFHVISGLSLGHSVTDHGDLQKYENDLKLLDLPNITFYKSLPNQQVLQLLAQSHFQIMPSLYDTYGYSILEGFSVGTPAITTNIAALPEFVHHNENGYLLSVELGENKTWHSLFKQVDKNSNQYWEILDTTYNNWAEQALHHLGEFLERSDRQEHYEFLSAGAINQIRTVHNSETTNDLLDNIYSEAIE